MTKRILFSFALSCVLQAQTPVVTPGGVGNAAGPATGVTPGSLVSIYGSELASSLAVADSIPLATSLNGASVTFNDIAAPLLFVSPGQINAQLPWNVLSSGSSGNATVVVRRGNSASAAQQIQVAQTSPALFTFPVGGTGLAIAINANGSLAGAAGAIQGVATEPAAIGTTIVVLGTGFGAVDVPAANGQNSLDQLRQTTVTPTVTIGGVNAQVLFSGLSPEFVGVNQLNVVVPNGVTPGSNVPIRVSFGGVSSAPGAYIAVRAP